MHELSIAEHLASIVLETAKNEKLSAVTKVNVTIGQMSQVAPDLLETAFRAVVQGTMADNALLVTETVQVKCRCSDCGAEHLPGEYNFICGNCGSEDIEIVSGMEIFVKSIEGE